MLSNENTPYHRAAKFSAEWEAGAVYFKIQSLIEPPECNLSAYRFLIHSVWHVAIVGDTPSSELVDQLERHLAVGEPIELPLATLIFLRSRRRQQIRHGTWVERHHRPGRRFRPGR